MLPRLLLAAALTALATPALAHAHVPAGKIAHAPAPIRCADVVHVAAQASHPRAPLAAPKTAQD